MSVKFGCSFVQTCISRTEAAPGRATLSEAAVHPGRMSSSPRCADRQAWHSTGNTMPEVKFSGFQGVRVTGVLKGSPL